MEKYTGSWAEVGSFLSSRVIFHDKITILKIMQKFYNSTVHQVEDEYVDYCFKTYILEEKINHMASGK